VADSPYAAADACEGVRVEYEPRPAVTDIDGALAAERVVFRRAYRHGDVDAVFAAAPIQLRERFTHGRCVAAPLEPRGVLADWDGETLTVWSSTQIPSALRSTLAASLGLQEAHVRVITPDVGGGFGLKSHGVPEELAVAAVARPGGRPADEQAAAGRLPWRRHDDGRLRDGARARPAGRAARARSRRGAPAEFHST